ncbi:uncharacterized protein LOC119662363 [Teleopsis dalmanni]|uniref:uncharacterized protein LOC119662363 n=1 Tax=Teleopsis dalmanni TaxID=139649 RepID=UPI0018CF8198|nr:uncharacterized protein LOC119662363 [Teleopsis dalmanni]
MAETEETLSKEDEGCVDDMSEEGVSEDIDEEIADMLDKFPGKDNEGDIFDDKVQNKDQSYKQVHLLIMAETEETLSKEDEGCVDDMSEEGVSEDIDEEIADMLDKFPGKDNEGDIFDDKVQNKDQSKFS